MALAIAREPSNNANLLGIEVDGVVMSPAFKKEMTIYTVSLPPSTLALKIKTTLEDPTATLNIDHSVVNSDEYYSVDMASGINVVEVVAIAQDKISEKCYTVIITRGYSEADLSSVSITDNNNNVVDISPVFNSGTTTYIAQLDPSSDSMNVIPVAIDPYADVSISGDIVVHSGVNTVNIVVRSSDNSTKKTYTIFAVKP